MKLSTYPLSQFARPALPSSLQTPPTGAHFSLKCDVPSLSEALQIPGAHQTSLAEAHVVLSFWRCCAPKSEMAPLDSGTILAP